MILVHLTDGKLGYKIYLAKEMFVEVAVLLLSRSCKNQCVSHHALFSLLL